MRIDMYLDPVRIKSNLLTQYEYSDEVNGILPKEQISHLRGSMSSFHDTASDLSGTGKEKSAGGDDEAGASKEEPHFVDIPDGSDVQSVRIFHSRGSIYSPNCGNSVLNVTAEAKHVDVGQALMAGTTYAISMCMFSVLQIFLVYKQLQYSGTQAGSNKMSMLTIGCQAIMDSYLCLLHITAGMVFKDLFNTFATISFLKMLLFVILEVRMLMLIWKARRPEAFSNGWANIQRELAKLYSRLYGTLLLGILFAYIFWNQFYFIVFVLYSFWIPQIANNAYMNVRKPFHRAYLFGMSVTRLYIPLYLWCYRNNFIASMGLDLMAYRPGLSASLVFWVSMQVIVLLLQDKFGPRFFIPDRFLPVRYRYDRPIPASLEEDHRSCVICMDEVEESLDYMLTPCNHLYHSECLTQWMEQKMECPTCRQAIPPP